MRHGGRPRREQVRPDSPFGKALKEHLRRVEGLTQKDLASETGIPEKTLSQMVKGKRTSGTMLRRDLRAIITVLHQRGALLTRNEADQLITTLPAIKALDERDPDDADIIALFDAPATESAQAVASTPVDAARLPVQPLAERRDDRLVADGGSEPAREPVQAAFSPPSEPPVRTGREAQQRLWQYAGAALVALIVIGGVMDMTRLVSWGQMRSCSANAHGVTLYTDIQYQGHCATFAPGTYELARYGLEQNVSSIRDPDGAYHITLYDKDKNYDHIDADTPIVPAEWDNRADTMLVEKNRPTSCHPGSDGIIAFLNTDYSGGCLFITQNIPDLTPLDFDQAIVSIQFVGSYQHTRQLIIYQRPDYQQECGAYWQDQSDLRQCARLALSVQVLPFTPPTPVPTVAGTRFAGNVARQAILTPTGTQAIIDGNLQTEWIAGHMVGFVLRWTVPVMIHRVAVWDRKQSPTDNNQINKLKLIFSDGTETGSLDMISGGPRCVDVIFPQKTVTWLQITPVDASGNNGYREVEVWATTGPQYSDNTCVNKITVAQTVPQSAAMEGQITFLINAFSAHTARWAVINSLPARGRNVIRGARTTFAPGRRRN